MNKATAIRTIQKMNLSDHKKSSLLDEVESSQTEAQIAIAVDKGKRLSGGHGYGNSTGYLNKGGSFPHKR